ncbi:MAG: N-acetylmuramoyl-L-alanine amidase [Candidatus Sumerlaea chitinivorans]|nr:N-acetylmuramoyl-L-alanine amidase [Candidatus Sumerlaea chitinivorans]
MQMLRFALVAAVLTAMVMSPSIEELRVATVETPREAPMAVLRVQPMVPTIAAPSRAPISAYASAHKPLEGIRICIDPGHGGQEKWDKILYTGGTRGVVTGQTESDVNLRVALLLRQYLEAAGADVIMTRTSDERCTNCGDKRDELDFRPNLANSTNSDIFVSIHHNEANDPSVNYTMTFFPSGMPSAASLADNVASAVSRYLGTPCAGARPGTYRILQKAKMPAVLVEASFMSNPSEDLRLQSLAYNKLEAKAIATGILNYVRATKGRPVDFSTIFAPIDEQAPAAQAIADASIVRKTIREKKSLFGRKYEEVALDATGRVISRRDIGGGSLSKKRPAAQKVVASAAGKRQISSSVTKTSKPASAAHAKAPAKKASSGKTSSAKPTKTKKMVVK